MIYLFDRAKKLQKIIPRKHIINATQTKVRNGIYQLAVEVPIFYKTKQGTQYNYQKSVSKAEFAGHYDDKNRFQLYKIYSRNITANEQGEFLLFDGVHIFFDEAKAMGNIHDRRFRDSEAKAPADAAFNSIGWTVIDYDVTDRHDINFYRASVTDAWNDLISTYGVEFDYELQFDGRKIISKNIIMKKQIGRWTGQRFAYGTNVMTLTQEQDESEVYTAAVGRGRGEESGDGFGPRLEFGDIEWSKDGITKPVGQNYIELPSATAEYGFIENGIVKPRIAPEVVFEDIEDKKKLADATYYWLIENCLPKATWKTEVARIGNLSLGDTVGVLYKAAGIIKRARVEKIEYNLLDPELSKLTLGDFHHFENRQMKRINAQIKRLGRDNRSLITQVKDEFDQQFSAWVTAFRNEFEQAKIDIFAQVEADRVNMEALLNTKLTEFNTAFNADMEAAYEEAQRNYTAIEGYVNTTVDTNRSQVEQIINAAEQSAKDYAEQQAQEKAEQVRSDLETVTSGHQQMLDDLEGNVMNIDDFLGDSRSVTLDERFQDITTNFEERIKNIDSTHYNMIRGTSFDNPDLYGLQNTVQLITDEVDNFARLGTGSSGIPFVYFKERIQLVAGQKYNFIFNYRTEIVTEMDYLELRGSNLEERLYVHEILPIEDFALITDGLWNKKEITFTSPITQSVQLYLGTNFNINNTTRGILDVKKPYLTTTNNREWLPHPDDDTQNVSEIVRRVTLLEDGRSELITRSEYDFETGQIDQYIKSVEESVEGNKTVLQRVEDWQATNGASIEETIYGFDQKVWLNDVANIGANLIPQSSKAWEQGGLWIEGGTDAPVTQNIRTKERIKIQPSTTYTLSSNSTYISAIERVDIHQYLHTGGWINRYTIPRNGEVTFTTWGTASHVKITLVAREGFSIPTSFIDHPDGRIKVKLEVGDKATPMLNAISRIEQLANSVSIQVQELDGDFLSQSEIQVHPGYVQLGSQRLGDSQLASIFRVSPNSIEAITDRMILNGDLYVDGDITALAVDAIEGRFSNLWVAEFEAATILAGHIASNAIQARHLLVSNAMVEKIVANSVYADDVTTKSLDAIEANIGRVRTAFLTSNVIESDHIQVGIALVGKMFATSARIDELITKSHFVTNVKAMSIEAVEGQFSSLMTKYLSANYIDVDWIDGKNAWFESMYTSDAMVRKLTAQTAFIRDVQAIEVTANQLNIQTLHSKLAGTEGGLTIYGPDGRVLINNSMLRASFDVQVYDSYAGSEVGFTGLNYHTESTNWQTFKYFYTDFKGSQLLISWAVSFTGGSTSEMIGARVRGFGGSNPIGTNAVRLLSENGSTRFYNQVIDLGVPNYSTIQAYLELRRDPDGIGNRVLARVLRVSLIN